MASIVLDSIDLEYPLRDQQISFKEYLLKGVFRKRLMQRPTVVHALRQLSLKIGVGERVAIVGHNGAGKTTLLRTIAGIYPIKRGSLDVRGSICSLFDIMLGFEPEASGWENVRFRSYLQGATPKEVDAKLDEIGDFTELGDFLKLPVRCYSSGMATRLAFAIATSTEPEILLLDEFFATGDIAFQKKAEARMNAFLDRAKIVIMVGHNLEYLRVNCQRAIWLDHGQLRADGPATDIIQQYIDSTAQPKVAAVAA